MTIHLKIDYRKFPAEPCEAFPRRLSASRPVVPVSLINKNKRVRHYSLIDSGADFCIFHGGLGEEIDLKVKSGKKLTFFGIGDSKGTKLTAYFHDIEMEISGWKFPCYAGFSYDLDIPYGVLGQVGFFNLFRVQFDYGKQRIELWSKDQN